MNIIAVKITDKPIGLRSFKGSKVAQVQKPQNIDNELKQLASVFLSFPLYYEKLKSVSENTKMLSVINTYINTFYTAINNMKESAKSISDLGDENFAKIIAKLTENNIKTKKALSAETLRVVPDSKKVNKIFNGFTDSVNQLETAKNSFDNMVKNSKKFLKKYNAQDKIDKKTFEDIESVQTSLINKSQEIKQTYTSKKEFIPNEQMQILTNLSAMWIKRVSDYANNLKKLANDLKIEIWSEDLFKKQIDIMSQSFDKIDKIIDLNRKKLNELKM